MSGRKGYLAVIALLIVFASSCSPSIAYVERQLELCSGNLLFQDQFYFTAPVQMLFHSQTAAGTDAEAFSFSPVPGGGFALAQTSSASKIAADTGFFMAFSSFKRFNCPTGEGYLHTSINDPLVSRTPVFSSLIFPRMIKRDQIKNSETLPGNAPFISGSPGANLTMTNKSAKQASSGMPTIKGTGDTVLNNTTITGSRIKKQFSSNQIGEPDTSNILSVSRRPTPQPAPLSIPPATPHPTAQPVAQATPLPASTFGALAANISGKGSPTPTSTPTPASSPTPAPAPSPASASRPSIGGMPKATSLLAKPLSRQANKPFTPALDPDFNPRTACRDDVANIPSWDRLTTNVIGRSAIDSIYMNRTSYPSYINPWNAIKLANQFNVMSETLNMTHPGTYLQQRMWAL